jgi:hypothetical protein
MNDGLTYWKTLNGVDVAYTEAERNAILPGQGRRARLERVLERDSIMPAKYREYRERLQDLHFHAFVASENHVLFVRTRSSGVLYAVPGRPAPTRGGDVGFGNMHLKSLTVLADRWYYAVW